MELKMASVTSEVKWMNYFLTAAAVLIGITYGNNVYSKSSWMTGLRSHIGDDRLGDLCLPGSHDSGTYGINASEYILVDKKPHYIIAPREMLANWSTNQHDNFREQLNSGFRYFDLRIASFPDGSFRWWHTVSADEVNEGLAMFADFATENKKEVLLLHFTHFASPGDEKSETLPMPNNEKRKLSNLLFLYLGPRLVDRRKVGSDNPTVNQILKTGRNILVYCDDDFINGLNSEFWPDIIHHVWQSTSNTEDLFLDRSEKLRDYHDLHSDSLTYIGVAVTPNFKVIVGAFMQLVGDDKELRDVLKRLLPESADLYSYDMSFEGLHLSLLDMAASANMLGMDARPLINYTTVASSHFKSQDRMIDYWLSRKRLFKPNIIGVDNIKTSAVVDKCIAANRAPVPQRVSISFQGNSRDGYLRWVGLKTEGGRDGYTCQTGKVYYAIQSNSTGGFWEGFIQNKMELTLQYGEYPKDSAISIWVSSTESLWSQLFTATIQDMLNKNTDVYVRVNSLPSGHGFGFISMKHNVFGFDCLTPPTNDTLNIIQW